MGLTNNTGKLSNTLTSNGTQITLGGSTVTDGNLLNIIGNQSSVNVGVVFNNTNGTYPKIYGLQNVNNNFVLYDYSSSATRLTISTTGAATFSSSISAINGLFNTSTSVPSPTGITAWDNTVTIFGGNTTTSNALAIGYNTANNASYILSAQPSVAWRTMWFGANDYKFTIGQGANPSMVITSSGNVGIGTSSPVSKLSIGGNGYADRAITAIASGGDFAATIQQNSTGAGLQVYSNNTNWGNTPFKIQSNGGTQLELSPNAQLTITSTGVNPIICNGTSNQYLLISSASSLEAMTQYYNPTAANWYTGIRGAAGLAGTTGFHIYSSIYGGDVMGLYANGNYDFAGSDVSDRRLKENIEVISYNALEKINTLEACSYNMINNPNVKRHGFIAQEVQKVLPDLINGEEKEDEYLGLDYNGLLAIAIKAIQELSAKVTALENR